MIDADEEMVGDKSLILDPSIDVYLVKYQGTDHWLSRIVKNTNSWYFGGPPTHEVLLSKNPQIKQQRLTSHCNINHADSARRKSGNKYSEDIEILLKIEPKDARTVFYLAESYRNQGNIAQALRWYKQRAPMYGFAEESYWSLYQIASLEKHASDEAKINAYIFAWAYRPHRQEAMYDLCLFLRGKCCWPLIYALARDQKISEQDVLFVDPSATWKVMEECGVALYNLGRKSEALGYFQRILKNYTLNPTELQRTHANIRACQE